MPFGEWCHAVVSVATTGRPPTGHRWHWVPRKWSPINQRMSATFVRCLTSDVCMWLVGESARHRLSRANSEPTLVLRFRLFKDRSLALIFNQYHGSNHLCVRSVSEPRNRQTTKQSKILCISIRFKVRRRGERPMNRPIDRVLTPKHTTRSKKINLFSSSTIQTRHYFCSFPMVFQFPNTTIKSFVWLHSMNH